MGDLRRNAYVWSQLLVDLPRAAYNEVAKNLDLKNPPRFFDYARAVLEGPHGSGSALISCPLLAHGLVAKAISRPDLFSRTQAVELGRLAIAADPGFDAHLLRYLLEASETGALQHEQILRVLVVLESTSDGSRLVLMLMKLVSYSNRIVRSKVVRILAQGLLSPGLIERLAMDDDPRVRSNLLDGIATQRDLRAFESILRTAAADPHHRVSTTAHMLLCRLGDADSQAALKQGLDSPDPNLRRACQWAMRKISDASLEAEATPPAAAPEIQASACPQ